MKEWDVEFHLRRTGKEATDKKVADILRLSDGVTNFGRHTKSDNYLNSAVLLHFISRRHAEIECEHTNGSKQFVLVDHSVNGTYINDYRVNGRTALKEGDVVVFGHTNGKHVLPGVYAPQPQSEFKFMFERIREKNFTPTKSEIQKGNLNHQSPKSCEQERHKHGSTVSSRTSSTEPIMPRLEERRSDDLDRCTVTPDSVFDLTTDQTSPRKNGQHSPDLNVAFVLTPSKTGTDVLSNSPDNLKIPALTSKRRRNCTMTTGKVTVSSPEKSPNRVSPNRTSVGLSTKDSNKDSLSRTQSFSDPGSPVIPILNGTGSVHKDSSRAEPSETLLSGIVDNSEKTVSRKMMEDLSALKDISNTCGSDVPASSCVSADVHQSSDRPSKSDAASHIPQEGEVFRETVEIAVKDDVSSESMSQEDVFCGYVEPSQQGTAPSKCQQQSVTSQDNSTMGSDVHVKSEVRKVRGQKSKQCASSGWSQRSKKKRRKSVNSGTKVVEKCKKEEDSEEDSDADNYNLSKYTKWHYDGDPCSAMDCCRPCEANVSWVQCDQCDNWYHTACAGCDYDAVKNDSVHFFCGCL